MEKVAHEILAIDRWDMGNANKLIGLEATDDYVAIITPFGKGGTLANYLPSLLKEKLNNLNNSDDDELTNNRQW
jgi:hypothetical protein